MSEEVKEAPAPKKEKKAVAVKKERKVPTHVHLIKNHKGQWGGTTWCGISFKRKRFWDDQVQANPANVNCNKCLQAGVEPEVLKEKPKR